MADKILLYLLLLLLQTLVCTWGEDDAHPSQSLKCYNDYDRNITCFWNSTEGDTECTVNATKVTVHSSTNGFCKLEPVDFTRPPQMKCSVVFEKRWRFASRLTWNITVKCQNIHRLRIEYQPSDNVKLNPPPQPSVNLTAVSWSAQAEEHVKISDFLAELQWKQKDQPWSMRPQIAKECKMFCTAQLTDDIMLGEWYEARVRVRPTKGSSTWSGWSPTLSWKARTGSVKSKQAQSDATWRTLSASLCAVAVTAVMLVVLVRIDKTQWVYMAKRIRGPALPNPEKSFLRGADFQNLVSPHLGGQSYYFLSKRVDVVPVEVSSPPGGLYAALLERMKGSRERYESSMFSNPSYSRAFPPPVILQASSNLDACDSDTPYGPVGLQSRTAERDAVTTNPRLQQLVFPSWTSRPGPVVLEHETVQGPGRLEAVRVTLADGPNKEAGQTAGWDPIDFHKLFGSTRILNEGSIQVCSGYEPVQKLQADTSELPSLDSGVSSGVEDQVSQEDSLEDTESGSRFLPKPEPVNIDMLP